jgi:acetylornithine deacetylase/succinyl-diaminopimelate desuccinylase-like protein/pimeloyl-ACP methyl ester carboxylesterase
MVPVMPRVRFSRVLAGILLCPAVVPGALWGQHDAVAISRDYRDQHGPRIVRAFAELLAIPNVASDSVNIGRNAARIAALLAAQGARTELLTLPGTNAPPIVYGRIDVPGATRTVGVYVHYDGQPADPIQWVHHPWEPTLYTGPMSGGGTARPLPRDGEAIDSEWRIYARSAGDDKAPLGALFPVLQAFREAGIRPAANLVFFFEGEEEAGSAHLGRYLEMYRDRVRDIDVWLLLDGPVHQSGRPQLVFGVRGVTSLEITVYGAARELHSGHYGNWAPVPGRFLAELLASLYRSDGSVAVAGFYDSVEPLDDVARAALAVLPRFDEQLRRELALAATEGGARLEERILQPSLTIHGLRSADVGAGARNVIPERATASIGLRLVKGNDVTRMQELVEAHIRRQGFHIVREEPDHATRSAHPRIARVIRGGGYPAARTRMDDPYVQAVIAAARRAAGDSLLLVPGLGGSLPLYLFTDVLGKPAITVPIANHDNNQHAADENLRIGNLWYGMDLYAALLFGAAPPPSGTPAPESGLVFPSLDADAPIGAGMAEPCSAAGLVGRARCGVFRVPEDRETPDSTGRTVDLAFVVLEALEPSARVNDPIILLPGGPGQAFSYAAAPLSRQYVETLRRQRDVVLVDVRGVGRSAGLSCTVPYPGGLASRFGTVFPLDHVTACRDDLSRRARLDRYTTAATVDDLEDLREWLGYRAFNLLGTSYGTRVAQVYMRRHPASVRTAVLNGVAPVAEPVYVQHAFLLQRALDRLLAECRADAVCSIAHPDIEERVARLLSRFQEGPVDMEVRGTAVSFGAGDLAYALRGLLYARAAELPQLIQRATDGDVTPLAEYYLARTDQFSAHDGNTGYHFSVLCAEDIDPLTDAAVEAASKGTFMGAHLIDAYRALCGVWPHATLPPDHWVPVRSDVPTLLLSGARDPVTPPEGAEAVAAHLSRSLHVVVPNGGHGVGGPCVQSMIVRLVEGGTVSGLDASCMESAPATRF